MENTNAGTTMRALRQPSHLGPHELTLTTEQPRPVPGPEEYLIRVGAAGVNFADVMQSRGTYDGGPQAPYIAGFEAAGRIEAAGAGVTDPLPVGTHVIGTGPGAFAQYMVMPAAQVLPVPQGWSDADALGMVLDWATALAVLKSLGQVKAGETVLVHAAAGGVGQAAVLLARHYGARVVATASPAKHAELAALGVEDVLDGRRADLAEEIIRRTGGVDLVVESVGKDTFPASLAVARPITGRVIVIGAASGDAVLTARGLVFTHPVQVMGLHIGIMAASAPELYASMLTELGALIEQGVYKPGATLTHALDQGPAVLQRMEDRQTSGKHALDPWR